MSNYKLLKSIMKENGDSSKTFATKIGNKPPSISRKFHGYRKWTLDDVSKIKTIYNLSPEETCEIFL